MVCNLFRPTKKMVIEPPGFFTESVGHEAGMTREVTGRKALTVVVPWRFKSLGRRGRYAPNAPPVATTKVDDTENSYVTSCPLRRLSIDVCRDTQASSPATDPASYCARPSLTIDDHQGGNTTAPINPLSQPPHYDHSPPAGSRSRISARRSLRCHRRAKNPARIEEAECASAGRGDFPTRWAMARRPSRLGVTTLRGVSIYVSVGGGGFPATCMFCVG